MALNSRMSTISHLRANCAEIIRELGEGAEPLIITQNGEAVAVLENLASYEATQEALALLKLTALGRDDISAGRSIPASDIATSIRRGFCNKKGPA